MYQSRRLTYNARATYVEDMRGRRRADNAEGADGRKDGDKGEEA